jgi:predicted oxidoreductase
MVSSTGHSMLTGLQIDRGLAINSATGRHASASASAKVKYYDTSRAHITQSVEDSLRLMGIEQIDLLLIHRPDPMIDHHETGMTLDDLVASDIVSPFSNNCKSLDGESHGIQSSEKPKFEAQNNKVTLLQIDFFFTTTK